MIKELIYILTIFFLANSASATIIKIQDTYTDHLGNTYDYNQENLAVHPLYAISENTIEYTITRQGESFTLKKNDADYDFQTDRIVPYVREQNINSKRPFVINYNENIFLNNGNNLKSQEWDWITFVDVSDNNVSEKTELELRITLANNAFSQLSSMCANNKENECHHHIYSMTRVIPDCHVNKCPLLGVKK